MPRGPEANPLSNHMFNGINLGAGTVGQNGFTGAAALARGQPCSTRTSRTATIWRSRRR